MDAMGSIDILQQKYPYQTFRYLPSLFSGVEE